jgi:hypothetical protein
MTTISQKLLPSQDTARPPKITFFVSKDFRTRLKIFAAKNETSIATVCIDAITKFMDGSETKPKTRAS